MTLLSALIEICVTHIFTHESTPAHITYLHMLHTFYCFHVRDTILACPHAATVNLGGPSQKEVNTRVLISELVLEWFV